MNYQVRVTCFNDSKEDLIHQCNKYDQAEHFFWEIIIRLASQYKTDTNYWQVVLEVIGDEPCTKLHFSSRK